MAQLLLSSIRQMIVSLNCLASGQHVSLVLLQISESSDVKSLTT